MARLSPAQYKQRFLASEQANEIKVELQLMEDSPAYFTQKYYSPASDNAITFTDKHLAYISDHQTVRPGDYISNLRLKTRAR